MLHEYAHYQEGETKSVSVEAGLMDMLQRMQSGRFKVARCPTVDPFDLYASMSYHLRD